MVSHMIANHSYGLFRSARSSRVLSAMFVVRRQKTIERADFTESIVPSKEAYIIKWVLHSCRTRHTTANSISSTCAHLRGVSNG